MESLTKAHDFLVLATRLLDEVAELYSRTDLPERGEQIARIGKSLASVFEVQEAIYLRCPELKTEWLKTPSPHPEENREYGRLLVETMELWESGRRVEAVGRLRAYLSIEHPEMFREMATRQVNIFEAALRGERAV